MYRALVGLLAVVGTAASGFVAYAHGDLAWLAVGGAATAAGLAAFMAAPIKKILRYSFLYIASYSTAEASALALCCLPRRAGIDA